MSLQALCSRHRIKHQRGINVRGPAAGSVRSWQVIPPNPKLCRIVPISQDTQSPYMRESVEYDNNCYFTYDPQAIEQDQFLFLDKTTALLGGLCQAATNGTGPTPVPTITLALTASTVQNFYTGNVVEVGGQWNVVGAYDGGTKIATVVNPWGTVPNINAPYVVSVGRLRVFWVVGEIQNDFVQRLWVCKLLEQKAKQ